MDKKYEKAYFSIKKVANNNKLFATFSLNY